MSESHADGPSADADDQSAVATAAPPQPPSTPPATATAAPGPGPKRGRGCIVAALVVVLVVAVAGGGFAWWRAANARPGTLTNVSSGPDASANAFESAMRKVGTTSPGKPASPVELTSIKPTGHHTFDATLTYEELTALVQAFSYAPNGRQMQVTVKTISAGGNGAVRVDGTVDSGGSSYSGWVEGPVTFERGSIEPAGTFSANVGGLGITGGQADQAGASIVDYFNGYIAAAPGLQIDSATVQPYGIHVTGGAPDSISW